MNKVLVRTVEKKVELPYVWASGTGMALRAYCLSPELHRTKVIIPPYSPRLIRTGLVITLPDDFLGFVISRREDAKRALQVVNAPIMPTFQEEIKFVLVNGSSEVIYVEHGDIVANLIFLSGQKAIIEVH